MTSLYLRPPRVFAVGDNLQVPRVDARPLPTQMVKNHVFRDRATELLIGDAMRSRGSAKFPGAARDPITLAISSVYPEPAWGHVSAVRDVVVGGCYQRVHSSLMVIDELAAGIRHLATATSAFLRKWTAKVNDVPPDEADMLSLDMAEPTHAPRGYRGWQSTAALAYATRIGRLRLSVLPDAGKSVVPLGEFHWFPAFLPSFRTGASRDRDRLSATAFAQLRRLFHVGLLSRLTLGGAVTSRAPNLTGVGS